MSLCDSSWHKGAEVPADYFLIKLDAVGIAVPFTMEGSNRFACCAKHLERALKTMYDGATSISVRIRKES